jgi:hypothetical protein
LAVQSALAPAMKSTDSSRASQRISIALGAGTWSLSVLLAARLR